LQVNIPPDDLAKPPPPKSEPSFELEPLPNDLKYDFLDDTKVYLVIIIIKLSTREERLLGTLRAHRLAIGYSLEDLEVTRPTLCMHKINLEEDAKPFLSTIC
jgi:hypothetical protein